MIFGSSKPQAGSADYQQAYAFGYALAQAGYCVANGGYGGTMEASAKGAKKAGGITVGVTCEAFGRKGPNQWIDKEIQTSSLTERLHRLIELGDAWLVLSGGTGTLLELAMVWELVHKGFLSPRPILCVSEYWKPIVDLLVRSGENNGQSIYFVHSPEEVLERLRQYQITENRIDL